MMRIIGDTTTPTGKAGILIECTCATHPNGKTRAIMRAEARDSIAANRELIHGSVLLANHPALSRAPQIQRNGPWKA